MRPPTRSDVLIGTAMGLSIYIVARLFGWWALVCAITWAAFLVARGEWRDAHGRRNR